MRACARLLLWIGSVAGAACPALAQGAFADQLVPLAPDYAQASSWAATPDRPGAAVARPAGSKAVPKRPKVDVFYIHPTTLRDPSKWNQSIDDADTNAWTDESVVARQASVFGGCCRIFAPRYRQAGLKSLATQYGGDGGKAYALAYADVLRAFDHYIAHDNHGRPFILAGHSQGSLQLFHLLQDRIDGTPLGQRMVVAYAIGFSLLEGDFGTSLKTLKPCAGPTQTGCVIGWNSYLDGSDTRAFATRAIPRFEAEHGAGTAGRLLCIDPLALDGQAHATGAGTLPASKGLALPALRAGVVSAHCDEMGVLKVTLSADVGLAPLAGGSMHYHDYALFYAELADDAVRRARAFR
jgi:hypothetical protein